MLEVIGAGFVAIAGGVKRESISKSVIVLHKRLKRGPNRMP